jgi:signal transduction histidine kinase
MTKIIDNISGVFLFFVFFTTIIIAQNESTIISSVRVQNKEIPKQYWDTLSFSSNDTVTFQFQVDANKIDKNKIRFHIFLNGKVINLDNPRDNSIILSNLAKGNYILKVHGYSEDGWDAKPVVQQFQVIELVYGNNKENNNEYNNGSLYKSIIFYGTIILTSLLFILVVVIILRKLNIKKKSPESSRNTINNVSKANFEIAEKNIKKKNIILTNKIDELTNTITQLKKEFKKIENYNKSLKEQVQELKSYIINLETANAQLVEQKEKLTESKHKLEELHSQKEKLFATTVHDIKNPAAAIKGYVELLEGYDLNAIEQHEIMQFLVDTSGKILELAQKMSVVIANDVTKPEINFKKSSLKPVIDQVCNQNLALAKRKNIAIINNTSADCPEIPFDEGKIFEVVDNLVSNAIKFSREKSTVQVRSYFNDKKIFVEVIDNGIGLSKEDMPKLFTKGATLSSKPTAGEESSGLGLWIAKNIIEEHNGRLWAQSKKDVGSTFIFELPINRIEEK